MLEFAIPDTHLANILLFPKQTTVAGGVFLKKNEKKKDTFPKESLLDGVHSPIIVDPMGSYTGLPIGLYETPVQDADDL